MRKLFFIALCLLALCACDPSSGDSLLKRPRESFGELDRLIDALKEEGGELCYPVSGTNRQPVQVVDLNRNGFLEAVVFMRFHDTVRGYIFAQSDGAFHQVGMFANVADDVFEVRFEDVTGDGTIEIIVGWETYDGRILTVYDWLYSELVRLLSVDYSHVVCGDTRGTGQSDLCVIKDGTRDTAGSVTVHYAEQGLFAHSDPVPISKNLISAERANVVTLADGVPALILSGDTYEGTFLTDILLWRDGAFTNRFLDPKTGITPGSARAKQVFCDDIDGDGATELVRMIPLPGHPDASADDEYWLTRWYSITSAGEYSPRLTTYFNTSEGYYLAIPPEWEFTVSTRVVQTSRTVTTLAYYGGDGNIIPLAELHSISGDNRYDTVRREGLTTLGERRETVYAAKILNADAPYKLSADALKDMFRLISYTWKLLEVY